MAMGTIRVHEFATIDGVISEPSWSMDFGFDPRMGDVIGGVMGSCDGILLGRTTYQMFEPAWSVRGDDEPGAAFMNQTTKYVVSSNLYETTWQNSEVISYSDIPALKDRTESLYVSGSGTLVRSMIADGLVDELHLFVYPISVGDGPRLDTPAVWSLADYGVYENGVVYLQYRLT